MKAYRLSGSIALLVFIGITPLVLYAQQPPPQAPQGGSQYVPGEVLVKFKEGAKPQEVLAQAGIAAKGVERVHSIAPVVARAKKEYTLDKDSDGWFWFLGKKYREKDKQLDEAVFEQAYAQMAPQRKALYRNYKVSLESEMGVLEAVASLRANPDVEYAYPNYLRGISQVVPNDHYYNLQWYLPEIQAPNAWQITQGSPSIVIAVIDTGIDYTHPDLAANIWSNTAESSANGIDDDGNGYIDDVRGWDFVDSIWSGYPAAPDEDVEVQDNDPMDVQGHGTELAGIIAAVRNNGIGIAGIAPSCKVMPLKAAYKTGTTAVLKDSFIEQAVLYAADNGARVINMSFAAEYRGAWEDELADALSNNVVTIAGTGNDYADVPMYPAAQDGVIAVGASDEDGDLASFSNYGDWVDLVAPGKNICSTTLAHGYTWETVKRLNGTSYATAVVSAVAGLLLSQKPELTPEQVLCALELSAVDAGDPGKDIYYGYGRVDAHAALYLGLCNVGITSPAPGEYISGSVPVNGKAYISSGLYSWTLYWAAVATPELAVAVNSGAGLSEGYFCHFPSGTVDDGEYLLILELTYDLPSFPMKSTRLPMHTVIVDNVNSPPVFRQEHRQGAAIGQPFSFIVNATDPDPNPAFPLSLTYALAPGYPAGATFNPANQTFSWTPSFEQAGDHTVIFTATDSRNAVGTRPVDITTAGLNWEFLTSDGGSGGPNIDGERIVWHSSRDILFYNLTTRQTSRIYSGSANCVYPQLDGDRVLFRQRYEPPIGTEGYANVMLYNLTTGQVLQITNNAPVEAYPWVERNTWIDGEKIVWAQKDEKNPDGTFKKYTKQAIFSYNLTTGLSAQLGAYWYAYHPYVSGDTIVWENLAGANLGFSNMVVYNCTNQNQEAMSLDPVPYYGSNANAFTKVYLDKSLLAWSGGDADAEDKPSEHIFTYNLTTGVQESILTQGKFKDYLVAWEDKILFRESEAYIYDRSRDCMTRLTYGGMDESRPDLRYFYDGDIYGNRVVGSAWGKNIALCEYYYKPQPSAIVPAVVEPNQDFTIQGSDFSVFRSGVTKVLFLNGVEATVKSWSDTAITCTLPATAQGGKVWVRTPGGDSQQLAYSSLAGMGDVNKSNTVTNLDACLVARYCVGMSVVPPSLILEEFKRRGDLSKDAALSAYDAGLVAKKVVG